MLSGKCVFTSFIYKQNNKGPSTDTWGTPRLILSGSDRDNLKITVLREHSERVEFLYFVQLFNTWFFIKSENQNRLSVENRSLLEPIMIAYESVNSVENGKLLDT